MAEFAFAAASIPSCYGDCHEAWTLYGLFYNLQWVAENHKYIAQELDSNPNNPPNPHNCRTPVDTSST